MRLIIINLSETLPLPLEKCPKMNHYLAGNDDPYQVLISPIHAISITILVPARR